MRAVDSIVTPPNNNEGDMEEVGLVLNAAADDTTRFNGVDALFDNMSEELRNNMAYATSDLFNLSATPSPGPGSTPDGSVVADEYAKLVKS